jgi:hypothetical protein
MICTVTYRPVARQRLGKQIPAGLNVRKNTTSIARQRISKRAPLAKNLCFLRGQCKLVTKKGSKTGSSSIELDVAKNLVEFWRWQSKVTEKKWQERN